MNVCEAKGLLEWRRVVAILLLLVVCLMVGKLDTHVAQWWTGRRVIDAVRERLDKVVHVNDVWFSRREHGHHCGEGGDV